MNADDARTWVSYNSWANRRLLEACRDLTPEAFARELGSSHGSVRGTLLHIINGEWKWFRFWRGLSYDEVFTAERYPDLAAIERRWAEIESDELDFVAGLTDERMGVKTVVRANEYTLAEMFQHVLNHSTYHRGQIVTLLRQLGETPPTTDFRVFLDHRPTV